MAMQSIFNTLGNDASESDKSNEKVGVEAHKEVLLEQYVRDEYKSMGVQMVPDVGEIINNNKF